MPNQLDVSQAAAKEIGDRAEATARGDLQWSGA